MLTKLRRWWPSPVLDVWMNGVIASPLVPEIARSLAWQSFGAQVHRTARLRPGVVLGGNDITIGRDSYINHGVIIDGSTTIGANVGIGPGAYLCTYSHEIGTSQRRMGNSARGAIIIGDGAWIGANATILPGVTVGPGCVVAAGAVVIDDCDADGLYAGVPARRVKNLDPAPSLR